MNDDKRINGLKCPACNLSTLFLANGNYITCGNLQCSNPDYADALESLIDKKEKEARVDEATKAAHTWNNSSSTESFADEMNLRIIELNNNKGEKV